MIEPPPNQNQLEALRILWEQGELKPAQIQSQFSWPIENATLRSVLAILVEKNHITRKRHGKAYIYAANIQKKTLLQKMMQTLARVFAGGSHGDLVVQLMETSDIDAADLDLIRKTAAKSPAGKNKGTSK